MFFKNGGELFCFLLHFDIDFPYRGSDIILKKKGKKKHVHFQLTTPMVGNAKFWGCTWGNPPFAEEFHPPAGGGSGVERREYT